MAGWHKPHGHWEAKRTPGRLTVSLAELGGDAPPADHGDRWGNWVYSAESLALEHRDAHDHWDYEVDLERCETSAAVLDWIVQCSYKPWITHQDLGDLIEALDDLFGLQPNYCGMGTERAGHDNPMGRRATLDRFGHPSGPAPAGEPGS